MLQYPKCPDLTYLRDNSSRFRKPEIPASLENVPKSNDHVFQAGRFTAYTVYMTNYKRAAAHFTTKYTHTSLSLWAVISVTVSGCFLNNTNLNTTYTLQRVACQHPDTHFCSKWVLNPWFKMLRSRKRHTPYIIHPLWLDSNFYVAFNDVPSISVEW